MKFILIFFRLLGDDSVSSDSSVSTYVVDVGRNENESLIRIVTHESDANTFQTQVSLKGSSDPAYWKSFMKDSNMESFMNDAYESSDGYAIRTNPLTGKKEMLIAGTHSPLTRKGIVEWGQNALETAAGVVDIGENIIKKIDKGIATIGSVLEPEATPLFIGEYEAVDRIPEMSNIVASLDGRDAFSKKMEAIAEENGVEVVYGHSRGAAIASGMDQSKFTYIGLDGATFEGHPTDMLNIQGKQLFDYGIAMGHGKSKTVKLSDVGFHNVTVDKDGDVEMGKEYTVKPVYRGGGKYQKTLSDVVVADYPPDALALYDRKYGKLETKQKRKQKRNDGNWKKFSRIY